MNRSIILAILALSISTSFAASSNLDMSIKAPKGWRIPTAAELSEPWRLEDPARYAAVRGDFDGNGLIDDAVLVVSTTRMAVGLFVRLSKLKARSAWKKLDEVIIGPDSTLGSLAIAVATPGSYQVYCNPAETQLVSCSEEWSGSIVVRHEALDYWRFGSSSWLFIWDKNSNCFVRVTQGD